MDDNLTVPDDASGAEAIQLDLHCHNYLDDIGCMELREFLGSRLMDERAKVQRRRACGDRDPRMFSEIRRLTEWIGVVDDAGERKIDSTYQRPGRYRLIPAGATGWHPAD